MGSVGSSTGLGAVPCVLRAHGVRGDESLSLGNRPKEPLTSHRRPRSMLLPNTIQDKMPVCGPLPSLHAHHSPIMFAVLRLGLDTQLPASKGYTAEMLMFVLKDPAE